jgi:cob(I)alamin adenosyltransferase
VGEWPIANEIQFLRSIKTREPFGKIETEVCGLGFVGILGDKKATAEHIKAAIDGLNQAKRILASGKYQVVILDEIISAVEVKLLKEQDVVDLIKLKPASVHLVLTGHNKYPKILKLCDTVTDMRMLKHGYYQGVSAQKGVDY